MKTQFGNPLDKKTVKKDVAILTGIVAGAIGADILDNVPFIQKQNPDLVDGAKIVAGATAFMALKGNDPITYGLKLICATVSGHGAVKMANRHLGPFGVPSGSNSVLGKLLGMNSTIPAPRITSQRMAALPQAQYAQPQTQDVFANAVLAQ